MRSFVVVVPILDGKLPMWRDHTQRLDKKGRKAFVDALKKAGATRVRGWAIKTPGGTQGIIHHEGPRLDPQKFMEKMFAGKDEFAQRMIKMAQEVHGPMNPDQPPPIAEEIFDISVK